MREYQVWPYFHQANGEWNLNESFLLAAWQPICESGRNLDTWYSGNITTFPHFKTFIQGPGMYPIFVVGNNGGKVEIVALAWLNGVALDAGTGFVHFCYVGPYRRGSAGAAFDYWFSLRHPDGRAVIEILCGVTPETYATARRLEEKCGFKSVGCIPEWCLLCRDNVRVGAVISYLNREDWANGKSV